MVLISKQFGFVVNMLRGQIDTHLSSKSGGEVEKEEDCYHRSADLLYCTSSELHSQLVFAPHVTLVSGRNPFSVARKHSLYLIYLVFSE